MRCLRQCPGGTTEIVQVSSRIVRAGCPNVNQVCSSQSTGSLPAITVCVQNLHTESCVSAARRRATATTTMLPVGTPTVVTPGAGYAPGDELSVVGGTSTETAVLVVTNGKTVLGQDETDYSASEENGTFTGGSGYLVSSTITMSDGTVVVVDSVSTGAVTAFTITTISTTPHTSLNDTITQSFTSAEFGTGFSMTVDIANLGVFAATHKLVAEVVVGEYTILPTDPVATVATTFGSGATFGIDWGVKTVTVTDGGDGYTLAPAVSFSGSGGSGTTAVAALTGDAISSITVTAPGSGYTERATVTVAAP